MKDTLERSNPKRKQRHTGGLKRTLGLHVRKIIRTPPAACTRARRSLLQRVVKAYSSTQAVLKASKTPSAYSKVAPTGHRAGAEVPVSMHIILSQTRQNLRKLGDSARKATPEIAVSRESAPRPSNAVPCHNARSGAAVLGVHRPLDLCISHASSLVCCVHCCAVWPALQSNALQLHRIRPM